MYQILTKHKTKETGTKEGRKGWREEEKEVRRN